MTKSKNNNYFAEIQTLMPNKDLLEKFSDTNTFKQVYTDGTNPPPVLSTTKGAFIPDAAALPNGFLFPPQGGYHAGANFNPAMPTPTGDAGSSNLDPNGNDKGLPDDKIGWICAIQDPKSPLFDDNGAIIPANLDIAKAKYQNMRQGKAGDTINNILSKLSQEGSGYCKSDGTGEGAPIDFKPPRLENVDDKGTATPMNRSQIQKAVKKHNETYSGKPGYELGCTDANGSILPNCGCDPNCFPGVLGGMSKPAADGTSKPMPLGPCAPASKLAVDGKVPVGGTLTTAGVPQCIPPAGQPPVTDQCFDSAGNPIAGVKPDPNTGECPAPSSGAEAGTSQCPSINMPSPLPDPSSSIAEAMGMNQVCSQSATTTAASGEISGNMNLFLANASIGGSFTSSSSTNTSTGCGQRMMQMVQDTQNISNLTCNVNNATAKTSIRADANTTLNVSIRTPTTKQSNLMANELSRAQKNLMKFAEYADKNGHNDLTKNVLNSMNKQVDMLIAAQKTTITGTKFEASSEMSISATSSTSITTAQQMVSQALVQIKEQAFTQLKEDTGVGAGPTAPNINELIDQQLSNNLSNISAQISTALADSSVSGTDNVTVNVVFPYGTTLAGDVFKATNNVDISAQAISSIVSQQATQIANQLVTDATNSQSNDVTNKGLDDLVNALGKANSDAMKAIESAGIITAVIVGIALIVLVFMMFRPSKPGEGPSFASSMADKATTAAMAAFGGKFEL